MRNTIRLSLLASVLVLNASAADDLASMFKEGKISGQIREFSVIRQYLGTDEYTRRANAIGGYLKYETGAWNGLSLGSAFYTTNGFMLDDKTKLRDVDPTLLGKNNDSYTILGEAYLQYKNGNTTFKGGRQKLDNPMMGSDDVRMVPNLFEAYMLTNTDIKDITVTAGQVTKFAQGTFGRVYNASNNTPNAILSVTSGYSMVDSRDQVGQFVDMGTYAIGENTGGVSVAGAIYTGMPGLKLQVWDYYAKNILNTVYAEANYGWSYANGVSPYVGAQYISERDVGSNNAKPALKLDKIESDFVAAKAGVKVANFDVYAAISHNSKENKETAANGGTLSPWGGMPAYTQGMVTRHQFMAGTDAWKVAGNYDWKSFGVNLNTGLYYTSFDMDRLNGLSPDYEWTATEAGFDMIYYPESVKNLQVRFRGNFPREFSDAADGTKTSWSEYRFILNYNF